MSQGNDPMADPFSQQLSQKNAKSAAAYAEKTREIFDETHKENRQSYEKFYNGLALFSGGTVALSVTFLGYLKSLPGHAILHPRVLAASWIVLFVCLITALFD